MGLDLDAPDHTTLSRRSQHLDIKLRPAQTSGPIHLIEQVQTGYRVVGGPIGQRLCDDHAISIDAEVQLLPAPLALPSLLRGGPLAFANDREPSAVNDEMSGFPRGDSTKFNVKVLAAP